MRRILDSSEPRRGIRSPACAGALVLCLILGLAGQTLADPDPVPPEPFAPPAEAATLQSRATPSAVQDPPVGPEQRGDDPARSDEAAPTGSDRQAAAAERPVQEPEAETDLEAGTYPIVDTSTYDISRKRLPDVQATVVPKAATPRTPPRLDDPLGADWHFQRAQQAAATGDRQLARKELAAALSAAPGTPRFILWQLLQALRHLDAVTFTSNLKTWLHNLREHPLEQLRLAAGVYQVVLVWATVFWTLLVCSLTLSRWRFLAHDLSAWLLRDNRHTPRLILPALLPIVFLTLKPGWLGLLALMSIPLFIQLRGRMRGLLTTAWLLVCALVLPVWPPVQMANVALDPASEAVLLDRACVRPPSTEATARLREALAGAQDPQRRTRLQVALAIQEARRGRYTKSNQIFAEVLEREPNSYPALVGRANNTYYLGRLDKAVDEYQAAAGKHPERGAIQYNLAQVYFKKLFVPEAADALQKARNLGCAVASSTADPEKKDAYTSVFYPGLTADDLWAACRFEARAYDHGLLIASWARLLGSPPCPLFVVVGAPFLLALVLRFFSNQKDKRSCENCGVPVCRSCCRIRDKAWLCPVCGETADRSRSNMILATLLKNRSRSEGMAHSQRVALLGRFIPGAGHLTIGRLPGAVLRLVIASCGWFGVLIGWAFDPIAHWSTPGLQLAPELIEPFWLPLPSAAWHGWTAPGFLLGVALILTAHILALVDGSRLRGMIPERISLVPAETAKPTATSVSPDAPAAGGAAAIGAKPASPQRQTIGTR